MSETRIDAKGGIVIPRYIREKLGIKEGMLVLIEESEEGVLLRPKRWKKRKIEEFFGLHMERTDFGINEPPDDKKSIWE